MELSPHPHLSRPGLQAPVAFSVPRGWLGGLGAAEARPGEGSQGRVGEGHRRASLQASWASWEGLTTTRPLFFFP